MSRGRTLAIAALLLAAATAVTWLRFSHWLPAVWFGDDLRDYYASVDGLYASGPGASLVTTFAGKWRPVFTFTLWALHSLFATDLAAYQVVTVLVHAATGVLLFRIALSLSRSIPVALLLALVFLWSRFATYQVTQINGLIEMLPQLILLAALALLLGEHRRIAEYRDDGRWHGRLHLAMALLAVAAHTHERYLGAVAGVALALMLLPGVSRRERIVLAAEAAAIAVFNVLMKVWVLGIPFFIGAGGRPMDADALRSLGQLADAILSWFWFNSGPGYLAGPSIVALGTAFVVLAAVTAAATIAILALGLAGAIRARAPLWPALLLLVCGGAVVMPAIVSFRLEQRWLLCSFALLLLLAAWASQYVRSRDLATGFAALMACGSLVIDQTVTFAAERQFFLTYSMRLAEAVRPLADGRTDPIVFEGSGGDLCAWILTEGQFFRMYQGATRPVYCIGPDWAYPSAPPDGAVLRYRWSPGGFVPAGAP